MQSMKIEESVNDLLRLGLLLDNGGVIVRVGEVMAVEGLGWLEDYFSAVGDPNNKNYNEVLLFGEGRGEGEYQDCFLAAVKGAGLVRDTLETMCRAIESGSLQFAMLKEAVDVD